MNKDHSWSPVVVLGIALVLAAALFAALSGFGTRMAWWNYRTGFSILRWSAFGALSASVICAIGLVVSSLQHKLFFNAGIAVIGVLIGLVTAGIPWYWMQIAKQLPAIHDITTDANNPPEFSAILAIRTDAQNAVEYGGQELANQQLKAYPDIKTMVTVMPVQDAFDHALNTAKRMGWQVIDANVKAGRIEAVDTTFWFGFKDDVVVRILPDSSGSRIDIRSVSRVGKGDIGTNAKRIMQFMAKMSN